MRRSSTAGENGAADGPDPQDRERVSDEPDATGPDLICTGDDRLLDVLLDWCSAIGSTPEVVRDAGMARRSWRAARLVLVGDDLASEIAADRPAKRAGVFVAVGSRRPTPWDSALVIGAEDVLDTDDSSRALDLLTAAADGRSEASLVAVVGGAGGAGASCLAAGVAFEASRRGHRVLLVDGDPVSGGLDVLLGIEHVSGLRWPDLGTRDGPMTARALIDALPEVDGVWVLSCDRDGTANDAPVARVLAAAMRGFDLVVCDVGRQVDSRGLEMVTRAALTVVVVPTDIRGVSGAHAVLRRLRPICSSLSLVTSARRPGLSADAIEEALETPVIGRIRLDPHLRAAIDQGGGPHGSTALRRAAAPALATVRVA
jgi:secretion/DNA translocation related CpaE-like protein